MVPSTSVTTVVSRIGRTLRQTASAADTALLDPTRALAREAGSAARHGAAVGDAAEGALRIRVLASETDGDGLAMVDAMRRRGADAALWSFAHLDAAPSASAPLRYRGVAQPNPDLVIPYDPHIASAEIDVLRRLEERGIAMLNSADGIAVSHDKGTTAERLLATGVPHPETITVSAPDEVRAAVEQLARPGVPTFLKNPVGTQGIGVAGLTDPEQAIAVGQLVTSVPGGRRLLVQGGIPLPAGAPRADTRLFVVNGKVVATMDRVQHDASKAATGLHSGGVGVPRTATAREQEIAEAAARELGIADVAGVDLMGGRVLEANYGPGHQIGRITGVNVTDLVSDLALTRAAAARAAASAP